VSRKRLEANVRLNAVEEKRKGRRRKMKKILFISFVLFVFVAMGACAGKTPSGQKILRVRGAVATYEPGKMLKLEDRMEIEGFSEAGDFTVIATPTPGEYTFVITPATDVKGNIDPKDRVLIRYTETGGAKTALSIEVVRDKK
jgi:hypothetical protein